MKVGLEMDPNPSSFLPLYLVPYNSTTTCLSSITTYMVTLAGYCVHSTLVPAIVPILFFPPTEQIDYKGKFSSNGRRCVGKRRKEGS